MLPSITNHQLMSVTAKALFTRNLDSEIKQFILFAAHKNGLVDEQGDKTEKYFSLMTDDLEKLCRSLTGKEKQASGLCACGCGRDPRGRGKYATAACRKKMSRTSKRLKKEPAQLTDIIQDDVTVCHSF